MEACAVGLPCAPDNLYANPKELSNFYDSMLERKCDYRKSLRAMFLQVLLLRCEILEIKLNLCLLDQTVREELKTVKNLD